MQYKAEVHTGKKFGAGTDANVFLNLFGEQGDTGDRRLKKSKNNRNKFEKGNVRSRRTSFCALSQKPNVYIFVSMTTKTCFSVQVDEFLIEAVNLKSLKKIRIGHDGTRAGDGWFLDKVVVTPVRKICFWILC